MCPFILKNQNGKKKNSLLGEEENIKGARGARKSLFGRMITSL